MRLHVIVTEFGPARRAVAAGATVVQLRLKHVSTAERVERGRALRSLPALLVIDDDVEAALRAGADGVHLGPDDRGGERALAEGLLLGMSVGDAAEARAAERFGAGYVGAGPVWATASKPDAGEPIGLDGLAAICAAIAVPVIAIGGVDATNAAACRAAGAAGVAVMRAAAQAHLLSRILGGGPPTGPSSADRSPGRADPSS